MSVKTLSVGELCRFAARAGDLDLRFTPAPLAEEGRELHHWVAEQRRAQFGDGYQAEVPLSIEVEGLVLSGRADGWLREQCQVEEVKSFRGALKKLPANRQHLHWAQVQCYGWMLCEKFQLESIRLALVYVDADDRTEQLLVEHWSCAALAERVSGWCRTYAQWHNTEQAHCSELHRALADLSFPYPHMHTSQRKLAENVYLAIKHQRFLLAQAPTGTGKTLASLFPALVAKPQYDKLFFLTAKTPGREQALAGLKKLNVKGLRLLELTARAKACEYPGRACHGDECPLARGFFDRLPAARAAAAERAWLDAASLRQLAREHQLCPYYLAQEMCRWVDVIVADYNYYFDGSALLYALTREHQWRALLLIDEAHNLVDRARAMYSLAFTRKAGKLLRKRLPASLLTALKSIDRAWTKLVRPLALGERKRLETVPQTFVQAVQKFTLACSQWQSQQGSPLPELVLDYYFAALQLAKLAEQPAELLAENYIIDVTKIARGEAELHWRNVLPAVCLAPRFEAAHTAVLFSATLTPLNYPKTLLGLPDNTVLLSLPAPFKASQLEVKIYQRLSTRYRHRQASLERLVTVIGEQCLREPGNYLGFFSSFDYLAQVQARLRSRFPQLAVIAQTRAMAEADRQAFVNAFSEPGQRLGLAVLGGAFGEGIDLPGDRLIGAFIATLGLPQINAVNEDMRELIEAQLGSGYEYTYLYPGLQKVVQAAGRVIRTPTDRGSVHLLDDRFGQAHIVTLLPDWWRPERVND